MRYSLQCSMLYSVGIRQVSLAYTVALSALAAGTLLGRRRGLGCLGDRLAVGGADAGGAGPGGAGSAGVRVGLRVLALALKPPGCRAVGGVVLSLAHGQEEDKPQS